jgi:hypothetical protein
MTAKSNHGLVWSEESVSPVTKSYFKYRVVASRISSEASGFAFGIADFACLGFNRYDIAGYPYDDENEALYSDWVKLGQDFEEAKKSINTRGLK